MESLLFYSSNQGSLLLMEASREDQAHYFHILHTSIWAGHEGQNNAFLEHFRKFHTTIQIMM